MEGLDNHRTFKKHPKTHTVFELAIYCFKLPSLQASNSLNYKWYIWIKSLKYKNMEVQKFYRLKLTTGLPVNYKN